MSETRNPSGITPLDPANFRTEIDGAPVELFTLRNAKGSVAQITNYGARIVRILVPDRAGVPGDVVQGYPGIDAVVNGQKSMGAFVGRFANRIANARFTLDGTVHLLSANAPPHCVHGGVKGSRFRVFRARRLDDRSVELTHTFADGEEGFPGTLPLRLVYTLDDDDGLTIAYDAVAADKATVLNFTDHSFFNLSGDGGTSILDHVLDVPAGRRLDVDADGVPSGAIVDVAGTPFDFRAPKPLGGEIDAPALSATQGYDHFLILDDERPGLKRAARAVHPGSGRVLEVWTTEPGVQVYTGNNLTGEIPRDQGKEGAIYRRHTGLCLEPSHYPDAPNHPHFKGVTLRPGEWYSGRIVYRFSTTA